MFIANFVTTTPISREIGNRYCRQWKKMPNNFLIKHIKLYGCSKMETWWQFMAKWYFPPTPNGPSSTSFGLKMIKLSSCRKPRRKYSKILPTKMEFFNGIFSNCDHLKR